jgi:DNA-binding beta-propeller fold protein YncE
MFGSALRGEAGRRCSSEGVGCSIYAPVGCGTCEDATIVPQLSPFVVLALKEEGRPRQASRSLHAIVVGDRQAEIVDLTANSVVKRIDLTGFPVRVAVSADGRYAAARVSASGGGHGIDVLDLWSLELTDTAPLLPECGARGLAFVPGTHDFFVACQDAGSLRRFTVTAGQVSEPVEEISGCDSPLDLVFTADGQRGLFSCTDSLWVYDVATKSVAWRIPGFATVRNLAVRMDGTRAYVNDRDNSNSYRLVVVDLATYDWIREAPLQGFPSDLFLGGGDDVVYSLSRDQIYLADPEGQLTASSPAPLFALAGFAVDAPAQ